jgi:hypothetical protein
MGLIETQNNSTYLYVIHGKLAQKVGEGEGTKRENKNGKVVYEKYYNGISGKLVKAYTAPSDYGDQLHILIEDGKTYAIQCKVESAFFRSFVGKLGSIDLSKEITISPYSFEAEGKKKQGFVIKQNGEKLGYCIGKDNQPEGFPVYPENAGEAKFKIYLIEKMEAEKKYLNEFTFPVRETSNKNAENFDIDLSGVGECPF